MKSILITGGTGSFGHAMTERMLSTPEVERITIFSRDELKQHEMRLKYSSEKLQFILGDVRDIASVRRAVKGVDVVFHAAALKQVPTGEYFPMEHILTNTLGTENVLIASEESKSVKKVVFLSTDKAVYPINTLGLTKSLGEHLVASRGHEKSDTIFCSVRYGNVMASRGSVIPLFIDKIKHEAVLPITDPQMTRFLLSLDDAIDLVLIAINEGEQGDLFVKKAPAATIIDTVKALKEIFNSDVAEEIIGVRSGEKIHETLLTKNERVRSSDLGLYFKVKSQATFSPSLYFDKGLNKEDLGYYEDYTSENTQRLEGEALKDLLLSLKYIKAELDTNSQK